MRGPRVSIVTPTYNRANYLRETIDSILGQTYRDFEYIIIDDGSSDGTQTLVAGYAPAVSYRFHENRGEAASTNRGWEEADGEYFAMVSSDDPMLPDWLEQAVEFMDRHPDVLVGYPDWQMIDEESKVLRTVTVYEYSREKLFGWVHCLPGPGALVRKSALETGFPLRSPELRYVSDLESWFRLALQGPFARIPATLATWRLHQDSTSVADQSLARSRETLDVVREFFARNDLPEDIRRFERMAISRSNYLASLFVRRTAPVRSMWYLARAVWGMPVQPATMPMEIRRASIVRILRSVKPA